MRKVDGGVFLNEPNIWLIAETLRRIFNESVAKECGVELTKVTVVRKDTGEIVPPGETEGNGVNTEQPKYTMEHVKDACELAVLLHSIPKGKQPLLLAAAEGFIQGMESQERLMSQKPAKARPAGERKEVSDTGAGSLWEQVESDCLLKAKALLKSETVPTEATVKMVRSLVEAAVLIDDLDLRWKQHEHPAEPFGGI